MPTIPVRELNQRTAQVLDEITASGETAMVTKNGVVRWQIAPTAPASVSRLDALTRAGLATRPRADLPLPLAPTQVPSGRAVDDVLRDLDSDDLWP